MKTIILGEKIKYAPLLKDFDNESFIYIDSDDIAIIENYINNKECDRIIIADKSLFKKAETYIEKWEDHNCEVDFLPELFVKYSKTLPLELIEEYNEYFTDRFGEIKQKITKRFFDFIVSLLLTLLLFPLMFMLSVGIFISSGSPVVFKQERYGKNGKKFTMYKFRTYSKSSDTITKFGKFLRKTKLDELPQFFNVLKGEMSIVGPRPEIEKFHVMCMNNINFYKYRLNILPGITGWAQINYKYTTKLDEYKTKTEYDLWYVLNNNIYLDMKILFKTFTAIFKKIKEKSHTKFEDEVFTINDNGEKI